MRLTDFIIEVGGFAATGSLGTPKTGDPRDKMLAYSTASYADGIKKSGHHFAMGSLLEEGMNTQTHIFLSGYKNNLRNNGSVSFTGSLASIPSPGGAGGQKIRSNIFFIAELDKSNAHWEHTGSI